MLNYSTTPYIIMHNGTKNLLRYSVITSFDLIFFFLLVAFMIYDMDKDGNISNGEVFQVLKMMVGNNLKETQLQQIVDKTVINADTDGDGKISFSEFCSVRFITSGLFSQFRVFCLVFVCFFVFFVFVLFCFAFGDDDDDANDSLT